MDSGMMAARPAEPVTPHACFAMAALLMIAKDVLRDIICTMEPPA
jgi:hypothetical protein